LRFCSGGISASGRSRFFTSRKRGAMVMCGSLGRSRCSSPSAVWLACSLCYSSLRWSRSLFLVHNEFVAKPHAAANAGSSPHGHTGVSGPAAALVVRPRANAHRMDNDLKQKLAPRRNKRYAHLRSFNHEAEWAEALDWKTNDYDFFRLFQSLLD